MARNRRITIEQYLQRAYVCKRAFEALCAHPYGLTLQQLIGHVYSPAIEPDWARSSLQVCFMAFNRKALKHRWWFRIRGHGGPGSTYQIWLLRPFSRRRQGPMRRQLNC